MVNHHNRVWALCALVLALAFSARAQPAPQTLSREATREAAIDMLKQLSGGVLVVRLNSNNRKMTELERLINDPGVAEKTKKRFRKMLETTREETRQESLDMMKAFAGNYNFSRVLFMYDTASLLLKNGVQHGYFINSSLEVDPAASLENEDWLLVYFQHQSPAGFVLLDQQFDWVQKPFPVPKRPVFKSYNQGMYFSQPAMTRNPLTRKWEVDESDTGSGFILFMSYNRKKQLKYFSVLISLWNKQLQKTMDWVEKEGD